MSFFEVSPTTKISYDVFPQTVPTTTFFIHGNLASNRWWIPTLEQLKTKYASTNPQGSVILLEFRGCGNSTAPASENDVTMQNFANDFIALIRSMNLPKVNLVGHSTGGLIAAMMLASAPELFNKAYLLDPVGAEGVKFDPSMIQAFEAMKNDRDLTGVVIGSTIHNNDATSTYFKDVIVEDAFKGVKAVGHLVLKALDGLDVRESLKRVEHPVKVVHGEFDQLLSAAESEKLAKLLKNGQFETFKGVGHCANVEKPAEFVADMSGFLYK